MLNIDMLATLDFDASSLCKSLTSRELKVEATIYPAVRCPPLIVTNRMPPIRRPT